MQPESPPPTPSVAAAFHVKCPEPTCGARETVLLVRSETIVTFRCASCRFTWSEQIDGLPPLARQRLKALPSVY
jgi:transposase-like protein